MKTERRKKGEPGRNRHHEERSEPEAAGRKDEEGCRCKEVSRKSIPELLKVAISDLSFWKKTK
jgi:hypothetical protein